MSINLGERQDFKLGVMQRLSVSNKGVKEALHTMIILGLFRSIMDKSKIYLKLMLRQILWVTNS